MGMVGENRSKALDGLRGLAVLQVVIYHLYLLQPRTEEWYLMLRRLGSVIDGLSLFFVLSGFLISRQLLAAQGSAGMIREFYGRRACRILPLYGVLLASYFLLRTADRHWQWGFLYYWYSDFPLWNYLVFWQNVRMVHDLVLGAAWLAVTWSLAVEMQFYALMPWMVHFISTRWLTVLCLASIAAAPCLRSVHVFDYLLTDRLDALATGVLLALALRHPAASAWLARHRRQLRYLVGAYLVAIVGLQASGAVSPVLRSQTLAALIFAVGIALLTDGTPWRGVRATVERLAPIGLLSYFIYLFHMPVAYVFAVLAPGMAAAALPVTAGLAGLSYRYIERPMIQWGHRQTAPNGPA